MRVAESRPEICADKYRLDAGGTLLWPCQFPDRLDAAVRGGANPRRGHLARPEQQIRVDLLERLPGIRIEQRDGRNEESLLVPSRSGAAVSAVAQIREVEQERRRRRGTRGLDAHWE